MEIAFKIGDCKHLADPNYLKSWLNGQPIEARWDGFPWQRMDRRHFTIIRTTDDFWQVRGGHDWKVWNAQAKEFKKFFTVKDSIGKYPWEFGFLKDEELARTREWFLDYDELIAQKLIKKNKYDLWKNHDKESGVINIDRSFFDLVKDEYKERNLLDALKNQGITSGTYTIGTDAADYATVALFASDVTAGNQMDGNLTGEHQNEETAIAAGTYFDTDTNANLLKLTAVSGAEHTGGVYGNGARVAMGNSDLIGVNSTDVKDFEISKLALSASATNDKGFYLVKSGTGGAFTINRNLIFGSSSSKCCIHISRGAKTTVTVSNNICYDMGDADTEGGIIIGGVYVENVYNIYNNTIIGCYNGIQIYEHDGDPTMVAKNNLIQNSGNAAYSTNGSANGFDTTGHNVTEDSTGPDAAYDDTDVHTNSVFEDYGNDDFRLDSGGDATNLQILDDGEDLSGTFTDDIAGQTRSTWYIGASEIVAAGGLSIPVAMYHYMNH